MPQLASTACDHCGKVDTDPKVHYGDDTRHNDCLDVATKTAIVESDPLAAQIIEAAENGTHGEELREYIVGLHEEETPSGQGN